MKNKRFSKKGFTLLETLTYVAILIIIIAIVSPLFLWVSRLNTKEKAMREVLDGARRAMEKMAYETREAEGIYFPTDSSNQLSLETKKYLPAGEETTYIDFYLCEDQLCFKKESQDPIVLTSDKIVIDDLSFTRVSTNLDIPSVQIDLSVSYKNPDDRSESRASIDLVSTVSVRSYLGK